MTLRTKIKIRPRNISNRIQRAERDVSMDFSSFIDLVERTGLRIYKDSVPVKRGDLKNSVKTIKKEKKKGGLDLRANLEIGPTASYAQYPDKGAGPSQGAYIPILGVRIKFGTHPGQPAQNYNEEARKRVEEQTDRLLKLNLRDKIREKIDRVGH